MAELETFGVGILGAGESAGEYVKAFRDHPAAEIVGLYSPTPGSGAGLLEQHGVRARAYARAGELFEDERVQIVVSATPPDARPDHAVLAAETGRHLVIEKPVALDMASVRRIRDAVAKAGVKTVTSFVLRWNPQFVTLRKLVDDGLLGELLYAEADYWNPSDPACPMSWRETRPRRRSVRRRRLPCRRRHPISRRGDRRGVAFSSPARRDHKYEFDPVVVASVRFENGAVGKLSAVVDADAPYTFNVRLLGSSGSIQNNRVYSSERYPGVQDYWEFPTVSPDRDDVTITRSQPRSPISWTASQTMSNRTRPSTTPTGRWPWCSRSRRRSQRRGQPMRVDDLL